jgi:hypothetical protein
MIYIRKYLRPSHTARPTEAALISDGGQHGIRQG